MEPPEPVEAYSDLERDLVDYLAPVEWPGYVGQVRAVNQLPHDWTPRSGYSVVVVVVDDAQEVASWGGHSLRQETLVRITTWPAAVAGAAEGSRSRAKGLALLAANALSHYPARPVSGVVATSDPTTNTPLATCTVAITQQPD